MTEQQQRKLAELVVLNTQILAQSVSVLCFLAERIGQLQPHDERVASCLSDLEQLQAYAESLVQTLPQVRRDLDLE
jgi:hypothetical protein